MKQPSKHADVSTKLRWVVSQRKHADVARELKVSERMLYHYKSGRSHPPLSVLRLVCRYYEVDAAWMIGV